MKKIQVISFIVLMLTGANTFAQTEKQLTVPLSNPGKPYTLDVGMESGSIKISSYAGKDVIIDVDAPAQKNRRESESVMENGMKRISGGNGYEIIANEKNNVITVRKEHSNRRVNLIIRVPQEGKLKLSTVNGGDIEVDNIKGEIETTNVNGGIRLTNISGSVVANTVNGGIKVNFVTVDANAPMAFSTLNGSIEVTLPAATKSNFKMKSDRGEIYSDFDMDISKSPAQVKKSSDDGMYKLNVDDWVYGKINGGGTEMMMKNMNGSIYIRKAK